MDRRQQKTRALIFKAFRTLLSDKKYSSITVQEIIDEANIGRSTFYAHFETKDALLKEMCTEIFDHVFSATLVSEETHDFSGHHDDLEDRLTHLLYHLKDNKHDIVGILSCESGELFMGFFKQYLTEMFSKYLYTFHTQIPSDFILNHLSGSFAQAVLWWIHGNMKCKPEDVAGYFLALTTFGEAGHESPHSLHDCPLITS